MAKGESLDEKVKAEGLKEITPEEEKVETEEQVETPPAEEVPEEVQEDAEETPEQPEEVEEVKEIPQKNLEGELRRLKEKTARLEREKLELQENKVPQPVVRREPQLMSYSPNDTSPEAEKYWQDLEYNSNLTRHQIYANKKNDYDTQRKIAEDIRREEREADSNMNTIVDWVLVKRPHAKKYRSEIVERLKTYKTSTRTNPASVDGLVAMVLGDHIDEVVIPKPVVPKPPEKIQNQTSINPPRKIQSVGKTKKPVKLTPEQFKWATDKELIQKAWPHEDIIDLYEKEQKRKTKK
jgi:hypothetical protein